MVARKRREDESFEEYRKNLKKEAKKLKDYLNGGRNDEDNSNRSDYTPR